MSALQGGSAPRQPLRKSAPSSFTRSAIDGSCARFRVSTFQLQPVCSPPVELSTASSCAYSSTPTTSSQLGPDCLSALVEALKVLHAHRVAPCQPVYYNYLPACTCVCPIECEQRHRGTETLAEASCGGTHIHSVYR